MHASGFVFPNDVHPPWSIMIVIYPYITGLVAGAFVVSALYHVFEVKELKPVARLALLMSLCFGAFATMPLLLHLHHPERCFQVMLTPSHTSAIAGFGFIYNTYMLILVIEIWLVFRQTIIERAKSSTGIMALIYKILALGVLDSSERSKAIDKKLVSFFAMIGIPVACILHGYVGFLFGALKANPWWSSSLMPIIFLCSAIVSGISGLILLYMFICWWRGESSNTECVRMLVRYLWGFLVLAVTLEGLELLQLAYESGGEWHIISTLLTEHLRTSYIIIQILIGSVGSFLILSLANQKWLPARFTKFLAAVASILILVQVFAMRWNVVIGGQLFSKSFRGFTEYHVPTFGREGMIASVLVMLAPFVTLWIVSKILPVSYEDDTTTPLPQA